MSEKKEELRQAVLELLKTRTLTTQKAEALKCAQYAHDKAIKAVPAAFESLRKRMLSVGIKTVTYDEVSYTVEDNDAPLVEVQSPVVVLNLSE